MLTPQTGRSVYQTNWNFHIHYQWSATHMYVVHSSHDYIILIYSGLMMQCALHFPRDKKYFASISSKMNDHIEPACMCMCVCGGVTFFFILFIHLQSFMSK